MIELSITQQPTTPPLPAQNDYSSYSSDSAVAGLLFSASLLLRWVS